MLKSMVKGFFSMKSALILMAIFAISIGVATFIENDYGSMTARALIYNSKWFEVLLVFFSLNLIYNIYKFKLFRKEKLFSGIFHFAFILIAIGAVVTRYIGYEGIMHIREGGISNKIVSDRTYITLDVKSNNKLLRYEEPLYLSKIGSNSFKRGVDVDGKEIEVKLKKYIPNAKYELKSVKDGESYIEIVLSSGDGSRVSKVLKEGESLDIGHGVISFNKEINSTKPLILIRKEGDSLYVTSPYDTTRVSMKGFNKDSFKAYDEVPFEKRYLYSFSGLNMVLKEFYKSAKKELISKEPLAKNSPNPDALVFEISDGKRAKEVVVFGKNSRVGEPTNFELGDLKGSLTYGSKEIKLPFAIKLKDFQLQRYPGSMSPSSYASEVKVIDSEKNRSFDYRIYMNHVLDYRGYRFFQSSYDPDEMGTVLSVNHDPGTLITYIGYFLLALGMLLHFFMPQSRFQKLLRLTKKVQEQRRAMLGAFVLAIFMFNSPLYSGEIVKIDKNHADFFASKILVQDSSGRIEPFDTLSRKVLAKIARKEELFGLDSNQLYIAMTVFPTKFQDVKMIYVHHPALKKLLNIEGKYAAFNDFFTKEGDYKLFKYIKEATAKKPAQRDQFDKDVIKVDERVNIAYMVYTGSLLRIIPTPKGGKWVSPIEALKTLPPKEAELVRLIMASYFKNVEDAIKSGDWQKADKSVEVIRDYQKYYGSSLIPPSTKIKAEILYNKLDIFNRLVPFYMLIGFVLLVAIIISLINAKFQIKWLVRIGVVLIFIGFIIQTFGMALRWYVAGHAPWSDGYESMVYISWATILAGFFFAKRAPIAFAATSLLGGLILFVAHLNWLDPQITNLVPVLKSYWLMIHVSVITASYGFLGLSALLAFIVLILFLFVNEKNKMTLELTFKELTYINEMSLIIGLVMVTIGNFLGGVWANESWGRYWGWDPKETWAAVTILVYAIVEHMRLVPGLNRLFTYNVASLLAYFSVIMTYFGVNFYLSGLHSYAQGDPVPIPNWVYWAVGILFIIIALAYYKKRKFNMDIRI